MSANQDQQLDLPDAATCAAAVKDLENFLYPGADTCEVALRTVANKWWTIFQKRCESNQAFHNYSKAIYRHLLYHMLSNAKSYEQNDAYWGNFKIFFRKMVEEMPTKFRNMFLLEWHDSNMGYARTILPVDRGRVGLNAEQDKIRSNLATALKD